MAQEQYIRISAAALCCIHDPQTDQFLLGLNKNRMMKGYKILTALGGALEVDNLTTLKKWGGLPQNDQSQDLRFLLPFGQLEDFKAWFYERKDREISPLRELREELVDEYDALPRLMDTDVRIDHALTVEREQLTDRKGSTGMLTHYFLEVYRVTMLNQAHWQTLQYIHPDTGLYWVTREHINEREMVEDGDIIQVNAGLMIQALEETD